MKRKLAEEQAKPKVVKKARNNNASKAKKAVKAENPEFANYGKTFALIQRLYGVKEMESLLCGSLYTRFESLDDVEDAKKEVSMLRRRL